MRCGVLDVPSSFIGLPRPSALDGLYPRLIIGADGASTAPSRYREKGEEAEGQ